MNYKTINLTDKVYRIDQMNWCVVEMNIIGINFRPYLAGPKAKLDLTRSVLFLSMANGTRQHAFSLKKDGIIVDDETEYWLNKQEAEEDLIILRTKYERS